MSDIWISIYININLSTQKLFVISALQLNGFDNFLWHDNLTTLQEFYQIFRRLPNSSFVFWKHQRKDDFRKLLDDYGCGFSFDTKTTKKLFSYFNILRFVDLSWNNQAINKMFTFNCGLCLSGLHKFRSLPLLLSSLLKRKLLMINFDGTWEFFLSFHCLSIKNWNLS